MAAGISLPLKIAMLQKLLVYDRKLPTRSSDGLTAGVVFDPADAASRKEGQSFRATFLEVPRSVANVEIGLVDLPSAKGEGAAVDVMYLCAGIDVAATVEVAKKTQAITFASDEAAVKNGAVAALGNREGRPRLVLNLGASVAVGMELDPQILRLAELVRS